MKPEKNQELIVSIEDLTYEGKGVAKIDQFPIFVDNALPNEKVKIKIIKLNKKYGFAKLIEIIKKSPYRKEIPNTMYLQTGIAPLQHLEYSEQLKFKQQQVINSLKKQQLDIPVANTIGMKQPTNYRNKAQIPVRKVDGHLSTGFYKQKSHDFIPMDSFYLHESGIDDTLQKVCQILDKYNVSAYNEQQHEGVLRHIIVRKGHYTNEMMITLVTRKNKLFKADQIAKEIIEACPEVVSVMQNVNSQKTNVILGDINRCLAGKDYIVDYMMNNKYQISAPSFYQVNTSQAELLYQKGLDLAQLSKDDIVIDTYCGIGTITLSIAPHVNHVYGVEVVDEAIINARNNAKLNGYNNTTFVSNEADKQLILWQEEEIQPDVVFVDPPRKGLTDSFIDTLKQIKPNKIVYISCNVSTFARDIAKLQDVYNLNKVYPFDLFPWTTHVEVVSMLSKK